VLLFGHLNIVYFAVPGKVEKLVLKPGSDRIVVEWIPGSNSDCVRNYIIYWVKALSGSSGNTIGLSGGNSLTIEGLGACEEYNVSVRAVDAKGDGDDAVTDKTTTGNYHTHIILLCL
jgi:hypothetical protein